MSKQVSIVIKSSDIASTPKSKKSGNARNQNLEMTGSRDDGDTILQIEQILDLTNAAGGAKGEAANDTKKDELKDEMNGLID